MNINLEIKKIRNLIIILLFSSVSSLSFADCVWTSYSRNGVYAYGFIVNKTGTTTTSIMLYLGGYVGSMSSTSDKIYYNGQYWTIGSYVQKGCLGGKNCSAERWEYYACSTPAVSFSYYGYENSTQSCPASTPSGSINIQRRYEVWSDGSIKNYGDWYETSRNCSAVLSYYGYNNSTQSCPATTPNGVINIQQRYEVWTDGSIRNYSAWYETSRSCSAVLSYYGYNNSTSACPAAQPSGVINIQQRYEVWTDGSVRNYSAWYETSRTCTAVYQSTETGYQALACSTYGGAYTEGGNGITQARTREIWSDGPRAWSAYTTTVYNCYKTVADTQAQKTYACAEGQTGKIIKEPRRTHIEYAGDANKTQAEKDALNEKNSTVWIEYTISNTCTNVPDKIWTETGTKTVSCGAGQEGTATQTGTYTYTYNSVTKQTTSSFAPISTDTSSCSNTTTDVAMETQTKACPSGQTGIITEYRYVATDSNGVKTYPQGTTYQSLSNTCSTNNTAADTITTNTIIDEPTDLLSNSTLKASDTESLTKFANYVKSVDTSKMKAENYNLNIVVDDMTNYNVSTVSTAVNTFQNKVSTVDGTTSIKISLPTDLSKYSAMKGKKVSDKAFKKVVIDQNGTATITYTQVGDGIRNNTESTFRIPVLENVSNINNIIVQ